MKRSGMVVILLVGIALLMMSCLSVAMASDEAISPAYLYTRKVVASLSIDANGQASCFGSIKASSQSDIALTITLYRKVGSTWVRVTSWSKSATATSLRLNKAYTVSQGTYKLVTSGSVTTSEGNTENLTETSTQMTYPAE